MAKRIKHIRIPEEEYLQLVMALNGANLQVSRLISLVKQMFPIVQKYSGVLDNQLSAFEEIHDKAKEMYENRFIIHLDAEKKCLKIINTEIPLSEREVRVLREIFRCYLDGTVAKYGMFGLGKESLKHIVKRLNHRFNRLFEITSERNIGYVMEISPFALDNGCNVSILKVNTK